MSRQSEETRKRAKQIRAEVLSRLDVRSGEGALRADIAELKELILHQQQTIERLVHVVESLTHAVPAAALPVTVPRPLTTSKRQILERIQELRSQELSFSQICEEFRRLGVPTLSGEGQWSKGTLWNLWKNHHHQLD